jgi:predicted alpha/beta-hydrolase family hydrolase
MDAAPGRLAVDDDEVATAWLRPRGARAALALAHGAGAGMHHAFLVALADALAARRIATLRYQFPFTEHGRGRPDRPPALHATVRAAAARLAALAPSLPRLAGGKSMGGRMTTEAHAAAPLPGIRGLVLVGFPLHPPDRPSIARAAHLAAIATPSLFLQGTRDALAPLARLRPVLRRLPAARLHVVDGADHGFALPAAARRAGRDALAELADQIVGFAAALA